RDVVTGHTTGVEGAHRQLGAGLTDRLGRDGADGLTDVDELAGRQGAAVALGAGAGLGLAGQDRADLDRLHAGGDEAADLDVTEVVARRDQNTAGRGVDDVDGRVACVGRRLDVLRRDQGLVLEPRRDRLGQATLGAAVLLADDDVLAVVDQT